MFSALPLREQFDALLGTYTAVPLQQAGDLRVVVASPGGRRVMLIGFDHEASHGSFGGQESDQLVAAFEKAKAEGLPVAFLMNTGGVRVSEGNAAVAGLRRSLRAALDATLDGVPMLALISRHCFGGASILATLCQRRIANRGCLFGMSGPKLIESIAGMQDLVAADNDAVEHLLGAAARAAASSSFSIVEDEADAYAKALDDWARAIARGAEPTSLDDRRAALGERLQAVGRLPSTGEENAAQEPGLAAVAARLLGDPARMSRCGNVIRGESVRNRQDLLLGLVQDGYASAEDIWRLSESVAAIPPCIRHLYILLDCASHSAKAVDEQVVLSEYLGCLALEVRACGRRGTEVELVLTGVSGGGIFAALAAGSHSVSMLQRARLQILPRAALAAMNKSEDDSETTPERALATGAIDKVVLEC